MNISPTLVFKLPLVVGLIYGLAACGTLPSKPKPPVESSQALDSTQLSSPKTELLRIKQAFITTNDVAQRNLSLLNLANNYAQQQDCVSSNVILQRLHGLIQAEHTLAMANILKAECELSKIDHNSLIASNDPTLILIDSWLNQAKALLLETRLEKTANNVDDKEQWQTRLLFAQLSLLAINNEYEQAIRKIMRAKNASHYLVDAQYSNKIWQWYSLLPEKQRNILAIDFPALTDHKNVLQIIEDKTLADSDRQLYIKQWLVQHPGSSLNTVLPDQIQQYLALEERQQGRTAILLPLSGRLANQGEAIKQGFLSAYFEQTKQSNQTNPITIEFIDTGSFATLSADVSAQRLALFDTIVGPLLKSHIEQVANLTPAKQKKVLLNHSSSDDLFSNSLHAFYALSPEQEARQLVNLMRERNIHKPVIIQDGSSISERMVEAFNETWQNTPFKNKNSVVGNTESPNNIQQAVQTITYTDNKSMRIGITAALDVLQSQRRIAQLSNISVERVYSVTRNRRDVDAFVLFAQPDDVELINPIIESSISLFTQTQVPVFATSHSYNHKQNKNTQRDLRNLVFVDMPWLLPEGRGNALSKQIDNLFNQPPSAFLRLFAFGYDALAISNNLAQLSIFKHMKIEGLSGILSIQDNQDLSRELSAIAITEQYGSL